MSFESLHIICFKKAFDFLMSQFQQISGYKITTLCIIHKNMRFISHLRINSLNKHIRYFKLIQILIKTPVFAYHLTFTWFNDKPVNVFLQKFFQTSCFFLSAVCCVFQNNTVTSFRKNIIHSLYQSWKNIIGNICGNYCNILRFLYMTHIFRTISAFSMKRFHISILFQNPQCLTDCMSAQGISL